MLNVTRIELISSFLFFIYFPCSYFSSYPLKCLFIYWAKFTGLFLQCKDNSTEFLYIYLYLCECIARSTDVYSFLKEERGKIEDSLLCVTFITVIKFFTFFSDIARVYQEFQGWKNLSLSFLLKEDIISRNLL